MSIEAIAWAFKQEVHPSSLKFVLVALANYVNADSCCWPSCKCLCSITGQDRKTILQNIDLLDKQGFIKDTGKRIGKTGQIKIYIMDKINSTESGTLQDVVSKSPESGTVSKSPVFPTKESRFSRKESQKRDTEPLITYNEPASCEDEVLPSSWQDIAESMDINEEEIFKAWRKFKDTSKWPLKIERWQAWLIRWKNCMNEKED